MLSMDENQRQSEPEEPRLFTPTLSPRHRSLLHELIAMRDEDDSGPLLGELRAAARATGRDEDGLAFRAACLVLVDLVEQGWDVRLSHGEIRVRPVCDEPLKGETVDAVKQRLRSSLLVGRNRQLLEPSSQAFIRRVEQPRLVQGRRTSIFDVIDSGRDLAIALRQAAGSSDTHQQHALDQIIRPAVVVCDSGAVCPITGLPLIDIWRYFRHTWSIEYKPTPGRTLPLLIRNVARPNLPIIGIAMLASAAPRLLDRDTWIGWLPEELRRRVYRGEWEASCVGRALFEIVSSAISEIRADDFPDVSPTTLAVPDQNAVLYLERQAASSSERRAADLREFENLPSGSDVGAAKDRIRPLAPDGTVDWRAASDRPLFKAKRAQTLSRLLAALLEFQSAGLDAEPGDALQRLLLTPDGRTAVAIALTEIRKRALASQIADVSVCGAVTPYNEILGGKLVTLLLASQEVRSAYRDRYDGQVSEIASRLAGRPITRSAELLVLTTTSLFGVGSSQYNRLHLRRQDYPGLPDDLRWKELGKTEGFGSSHLAPETVTALRELSRSHHKARRVNNIFGEGTSPRLRQIREGLEVLGVNSTQILHHSARRILYGCELVPCGRARLVGLETSTNGVAASAEVIATAWRRRWLVPRIRRGDVLERLEALGPDTVRDQFEGVS